MLLNKLVVRLKVLSFIFLVLFLLMFISIDVCMIFSGFFLFGLFCRWIFLDGDIVFFGSDLILICVYGMLILLFILIFFCVVVMLIFGDILR